MEEPKLNNEELADQSAKISQVESDEILARRLQEQFNQEDQNFQVSDEEVFIPVPCLFHVMLA